jgi:hypothetical protein
MKALSTFLCMLILKYRMWLLNCMEMLYINDVWIHIFALAWILASNVLQHSAQMFFGASFVYLGL